MAPFFIAPWLLLPAGAWLRRPDGRPVLGAGPIALAVLGAVLAVAGTRVAATLWADSSATVGAENHPAWRGMYRMMGLAYLGIAMAYLVG
jgi:hypothetical protein